MWQSYAQTTADGGVADRAEFLADHYDVRMLHARNDWMIRDTEAVVAVVDPEKTSGGTMNALKVIGDSMPVIRLDIRNLTVKIAHA